MAYNPEGCRVFTTTQTLFSQRMPTTGKNFIQVLDLWAEFHDRKEGPILQGLFGHHVGPYVPLSLLQ